MINNFIKDFISIKNDPKINHKLFKNVLFPTPDENPFKKYIEFSKSAGNYRSDSTGMYILHTDPINHNLSEFGLINNLRKEMELIYQEEIDSIGVTLLISEFSKNDINEPTGITKHYDPQDTIHWACYGSSLWHIYKDEPDEIEFKYIVEPGDIFFAKKHVVHDVQSLSPRGACILTMHKNGVTIYGKK